MPIFDKVFQHPSFIDKPPILFDIGASGAIHYKWKKIAKYSICIAFDADSREFKASSSTNAGYKKLIVYNSLVSDVEQNQVTFYLTKSPFCSSLLKPLNKELTPYTYAPYFEVVGETLLNSTTIKKVLSESNLTYIDWFKTDSQGIDLRLFKSIPEDIRKKIIVAEFEPGFIEAYENEDTATDIISFIKNENKMWMAEMVVKGNYRLHEKYLSSFSGFFKKLVMFSHQSSVGWAEILYLNTFSSKLEIRDYLIGWAISTLLGQHGHALYICEQATLHYNDAIFTELLQYSKNRLKYNVFKLRFLHAVKTKIKKVFGNE